MIFVLLRTHITRKSTVLMSHLPFMSLYGLNSRLEDKACVELKTTIKAL